MTNIYQTVLSNECIDTAFTKVIYIQNHTATSNNSLKYLIMNNKALLEESNATCDLFPTLTMLNSISDTVNITIYLQI